MPPCLHASLYTSEAPSHGQMQASPRGLRAAVGHCSVANQQTILAVCEMQELT